MTSRYQTVPSDPPHVRPSKRTTKTSQKLTLFPLPAADFDVDSRELPHVAKSKFIPNLSRLERAWLPRVSAYCTANAYRLDSLYDYLVSRGPFHLTSPRRYDEALYTPYTTKPMSKKQSPVHINISGRSSVTDGSASDTKTNSWQTFLEQNVDSAGGQLPLDISGISLAKRIAPVGDLFFFDYGVVVMWGFSEQEEKLVLKFLANYEDEKLEDENIEMELLHFHYNIYSQPGIYNDIITLKSPSSPLIKLTISHAIAQSVKLALFEGLIEETIESTRHIPQILSENGKIYMSRAAINKKIGQLFIMRINVNLVSNVLDTPEIFWSEPALEPTYNTIRGYLEISQRVELLNQRVSVISDLLDMMKENLNSSHGEQLEWIVIMLIAFEIVIGIFTICFDYFGYQQNKA